MSGKGLLARSAVVLAVAVTLSDGIMQAQAQRDDDRISQAPLDDEKQAEIAKLLEQALNASTPEEQSRLYRQILKIDPGNTNAFTGLQQAEEKIKQAEKERERQRAERDKQAEQEAQRTEAVSKTDQAIASGDLNGAVSALNVLRRVAPQDGEIARLQAGINGLLWYRRMMIGGITGTVVLAGAAGAVVFLIARRRKAPYVELVDGMRVGKRYTLEKDVTLIGSAERFEEFPNDIVVTDHDGIIAQAHCELHKRNKRVYVVDNSTASGTFVDNRKIAPETPVRLRPGSTISLGHAQTMRFGFKRTKG